MGLRDEINRVKKTSDEYKQDQQQKSDAKKNTTITNNGKALFDKLVVQLKLDTARGKINQGKLTGVLQFEKSWSEDTPKELTGKGYVLKPNKTRQFVKQRTGVFKSEYVYEITITATEEIIGAYKVLKELAAEEGIAISEMFLIDSDGIKYRSNISTITCKYDTKTFNYAVNYSMDV